MNDPVRDSKGIHLDQQAAMDSKGPMELKTDDKYPMGISARKGTPRPQPWAPPAAPAPGAALSIPAHRPSHDIPVAQCISTKFEEQLMKDCLAGVPAELAALRQILPGLLHNTKDTVFADDAPENSLTRISARQTMLEWANALEPSSRLKLLYDALEPRVRALQPQRSHKIAIALLSLPLCGVMTAVLDGRRLAELVVLAAAAAGPPGPGQLKDRFFDDLLASDTPEALKEALERVFEGTAVAASHPELAAEAVTAMAADPKHELLGLVGTAEARAALVACVECRARESARCGGP